jgi:hypothetical protein
MVVLQYDSFIVFGCMMILQERQTTLGTYLRLRLSGLIKSTRLGLQTYSQKGAYQQCGWDMVQGSVN